MATREEIEAIKKQQADDEAKKKAEAETAAGGGNDDQSGNADDDNNVQDQKTDYEAESKRYQEQIEKAEKAQRDAEEALARERFKTAEAKKKKPSEANDGENNDEDADKPLTRRELDARLAENREQVRREFQSEETTKKIKAITKSDAETRLVEQVFTATHFPSWMPLDEQIENAYLIANKKHLTQKNAELMRALNGKGTVVTEISSSQREGGSSNEPRLDPNTATMLKQTGYTWNAPSRAYIKKLGSGRTLFYDPKSKKRWTQ